MSSRKTLDVHLIDDGLVPGYGGGSILLQLAGKFCDGAAGITDVVGWPVVAAEIAEALDRSLRKLEAKPLSSASH